MTKSIEDLSDLYVEKVNDTKLISILTKLLKAQI